MSILKLAGVAIAASAAALTLRAYRPEFGMQAALAASIVILIAALETLEGVFSGLSALVERYGLDSGYFKVILKILGIAYIVQFAADVCRDAGESAVAGKVELIGRLMIVALSIPIVVEVLDMISTLFKQS